MKLKHGKKYENTDGVVYRVRELTRGLSFEVSPEDPNHWRPDGTGFENTPDLIRRHYTKPQPAHKLDLKPGDVVELVAWEDGAAAGVGEKITIGKDGNPDHALWGLIGWVKGQRPLFRVVSRA